MGDCAVVPSTGNDHSRDMAERTAARKAHRDVCRAEFSDKRARKLRGARAPPSPFCVSIATCNVPQAVTSHARHRPLVPMHGP